MGSVKLAISSIQVSMSGNPDIHSVRFVSMSSIHFVSISLTQFVRVTTTLIALFDSFVSVHYVLILLQHRCVNGSMESSRVEVLEK